MLDKHQRAHKYTDTYYNCDNFMGNDKLQQLCISIVERIKGTLYRCIQSVIYPSMLYIPAQKAMSKA